MAVLDQSDAQDKGNRELHDRQGLDEVLVSRSAVRLPARYGLDVCKICVAKLTSASSDKVTPHPPPRAALDGYSANVSTALIKSHHSNRLVLPAVVVALFRSYLSLVRTDSQL